jgi:hypothetical protein
MKTCTKCGVVKPLAEFPPVRRGEPKLQSWCRSCFAEANDANYARNREREKTRLVAQVRIRREEIRRRLVEYLGDHPCVDCGEPDIVVLEFDHLRDKLQDLSNYANGGRTWPLVLAEIEKCDVCCANCHRRRTAARAAARTIRARSAHRRPVQLDLESALTLRTCRYCGRALPLNEFPFRSIRAGMHKWICLECQRAWSNLWYRRTVGRPVRAIRRGGPTRKDLERLAFSYLAGHACVDCGEADPIVLDFDHVRGRKSANVSDLVATRASVSEIQAEIAKCDVRCANCHRKKTAREQGSYRTRVG